MAKVARVKPLRIIIVPTPTPVDFLVMHMGMLEHNLAAIIPIGEGVGTIG
tara:strand:+ start:620 stop:769 length:150 start_codon:yes stop_codon:yes gene_type:complete